MGEDDRTRSVGAQWDASARSEGSGEDAPQDATPSTDDAAARPFGAGTVIGRYRLLERIGAGGMGVVFSAQDPKLQRRVAIKLVKPSSDDDEAPARLLREAQAMAQLQHPNVVPVYDAGRAGRRVFLAMELLQGRSLRAWLQRTPGPTWREVLAVFVAAGRGLAAAHAAGIVHRDFKPSNVIVGERGDVRVLDFGLAHAAAALDSADSIRGGTGEAGLDPASVHSGTDRLSAPLTRHGHVMGTPVYMAPEQHQGQPTDPRTDQFSLCVALYQALFGVAPYAAESMADLLRLKLQERRAPPATGHGVPRRIRRAIERGLAADAAERFPTTDALLAELAVPAPRWRTASLSLGGVLALVLGGAALWQPAGAAAGPCDASVDPASLWPDDARAQVAASVTGDGSEFARDTWHRLEPMLDAWTQRWADARTNTCEGDAAGPGDAADLELRLLCLADRRASFGAALEVLSELDDASRRRAIRVARALPSPEDCAEGSAFTELQGLPDDPEARERIATARAHLGRAAALEDAGRYLDAAGAARDALAIAVAVDFGPVRVEAKHQLGGALVFSEDNAESESLLTEAVYEAESLGYERMVVLGATRLTFLVGRLGDRYDEGLRWARLAQAHLPRTTDDGTYEAALLNSLGALHVKKGESTQAEAMHREALAIDLRRSGAETMESSIARNNLGLALYSQGRYAEAIEQYERVIEIRDRVLGPRHPDVGVAHNNLGNALLERGRIDEAREHHTASKAVWEAGLGPEHPYVGVSLNNLGNLEYKAGNLEAAEAHYRACIELRLRILGEGDADLATTRMNLGAVLTAQDRLDEAQEQLALACRALETGLGPEHPYVLSCLNNAASLRFDRGDVDAAIEIQREVVAVREKVLPPQHPSLGHSVLLLGTMLAAKQDAAAVPLMRRALDIFRRGDADPVDLARAQFRLAQSLPEADAREAAELARAAAQAMAAHDEAAADREEVLAWIETHGA